MTILRIGFWRRRRVYAALLLLAFGGTGCLWIGLATADPFRDGFDDIRPGMTLAEVAAVLDEPQLFSSSGGTAECMWDYANAYYHVEFQDPWPNDAPSIVRSKWVVKK